MEEIKKDIFLSEEEKQFAKASPVLNFYYSLLARARELKQEQK